METRKDQLDAAKKLVGKNISGDEEEEGYEVLGGKIAKNLDDADKLDKHYRKLNKKAKEDEEVRSQKGKKGSKGKKVTHVMEKKDNSGGESDLDEDTPSEDHGKKSRKRRKKVGKNEDFDDELFYGTSEGDDTEEGSKAPKRGKTAKPDKKALKEVGGGSDEEEQDKGGYTRLREFGQGGGRSRKRTGLRRTKNVGPLQLQEKDEETLELDIIQHQIGQASKEPEIVSGVNNISERNSEITAELIRNKETQSNFEQTIPPQPQGQPLIQGNLSKGDGQIDSKIETMHSFKGSSGGLLASMEYNVVADRDIHPENASRLNRQDTTAQIKRIETHHTEQKEVDHEIQDNFEIVNAVVSNSRTPLQDQAVQTDDAVLFSLMESMMEAMPNDYQPSGTEDKASELKRLRREIKKARMQLRFWRSRNWVEKHSCLSPPGRNAHPLVDSPNEVGFSFYFNALKTPSLVTHQVNHPMTHATGGSGQRDYATNPVRTREHQEEAVRHSQPMNVKLLSNTPLVQTRLPLTSRRGSSEFQSLAAGTGLVIFGRSSTLITCHADVPTAAHLPTHENRISRLSPRLSGVQYQKA